MTPTARPLLLSTDMVRATLEGRKTKTRRVIKDATGPFWDHAAYRPMFGPVLDKLFRPVVCFMHVITNTVAKYAPSPACPYGRPGDHLWVRETWRAEELDSGLDGIRYRADNLFIPIENTIEASEQWCAARGKDDKWRPSIFMPRWASRLTLEIVSIGIERLQDITEADARAEGFADVAHFAAYWDILNAKRGYPWAKNPWVYVIEFKKLPLPYFAQQNGGGPGRGS